MVEWLLTTRAQPVVRFVQAHPLATAIGVSFTLGTLFGAFLAH